VQVAAVACRFCGLDFRTGMLPAAQAMQTKTNGMAVASLVLGILFIYGIGSILALVFGYQAKAQIDRSGGHETGRGMAIAGIVLGWIGVAGLLILIIVLIATRSSGNPTY
jgi:hypothetical protein